MDEKLDAYADKFGDGFPMIPLAWGRTEEEIIDIIDNCLKNGKDVFEMGYVDDDNDVMY